MGRYGKEAASCFLERALIVAQRDYSYDKKTDTVISNYKAEHVEALQSGVLSQFETLTTEDLIQREVREREQEKRKDAGQQGQQKPADQVAEAQANTYRDCPVLASGAPKQSEKLHLHHVLGE